MSDQLNFDVVIVGAGPAGLSTAIRLKQLCAQTNQNLSVCILEKGAEVGAHILSGAVIETRALDELIPNWKEKGAPLNTPATSEEFCFLTKGRAFHLPTPPQMKNHGNYIASLGNLCRWLAAEAESLGVEIYPGFSVAECLYDDTNRMIGVKTSPMGVDKQGNPTDRYQPGVEIMAEHIVLAEGCHGSLTKKVIERFNLRRNASPQTYGLGIKELWEIDPKKHKRGHITHTIGWPLDQKTYGGSFIYHLENNQIYIGFVLGLDYANPYLSPFEEMQRLKRHPYIENLLVGGRRLAYGARALTEGGFQSIPELSFPGGFLAGCTAGFMNVPKIKGSHTAMKSGMLAAEAIMDLLHGNEAPSLNERLKTSWIYDELKKARNIRPGFRFGLIPGLLNAAFETYISRGHSPWTLKHHKDNESLIEKTKATPIHYPKPDGVITFDRLSSVFLSNTNHEENQPCHLKLKDPKVPIDYNLKLYDAPEQRYCPAGVYEIIQDASGKPALQINAQNCVHCKTCDIKDPLGNIDWTVPEGGGGPRYPNL